MSNRCDLIFVYGTLLTENNAYGAFLLNNARFIGRGKLPGRLYDIGRYPGAVAGGAGFVYGAVYRMGDADGVLKVLDDYEGFGDDYQQPNEFIRQLAGVDMDEGCLQCWVYFYNHSVAGLSCISSGKYR